jgi:hypothetical protein
VAEPRRSQVSYLIGCDIITKVTLCLFVMLGIGLPILGTFLGEKLFRSGDRLGNPLGTTAIAAGLIAGLGFMAEAYLVEQLILTCPHH